VCSGRGSPKERLYGAVLETSCRRGDVQPTHVGIQRGERVVGYLLVRPAISADTDARADAGLPSAVLPGDNEGVTP
jgi:hypothetical protein